MRSFLITLLALGIAQPGDLVAQQGGSTADARVIIGARPDVPPFVWRDARSGQYTGFLWDICTDAVTRAGYTFEIKEINVADRDAFLTAGSGGIDLLCDPTTISLSRMKKFLEMPVDQRLRFSPIVFVANGSYVAAPADRKGIPGRGELETEEKQIDASKCAALSKVPEKPKKAEDKKKTDRFIPDEVRNWLKEQVKIQMLPKQPPDKQPYEIWGYVGGTTAKSAVTRAETAVKDQMLACPKAFDSHADAAKAFCAGQISRYFGDVEIVRAAIRREGDDTRCPADFTPKANVSYEPYAFVVSGRDKPLLPDRFEYAIYGMFSDKSVQRHFAAHFSEARKTRFLDNLFSINSLPPGPDNK